MAWLPPPGGQGTAPPQSNTGQKVAQKGANEAAKYYLKKNWNDADTGNIVGSDAGSTVMSGPDVGGAAVASGAGEAAGAAAGLGELADLAPLALL